MSHGWPATARALYNGSLAECDGHSRCYWRRDAGSWTWRPPELRTFAVGDTPRAPVHLRFIGDSQAREVLRAVAFLLGHDPWRASASNPNATLNDGLRRSRPRQSVDFQLDAHGTCLGMKPPWAPGGGSPLPNGLPSRLDECQVVASAAVPNLEPLDNSKDDEHGECKRAYRIDAGRRSPHRLSFTFVGTLRRRWQHICAHAIAWSKLEASEKATTVLSYSLWPFYFGERQGAGGGRRISEYAGDLRRLFEAAHLGRGRIVWLGPTRLGRRMGTTYHLWEENEVGQQWRAAQETVIQAFEAEHGVDVMRLDAWHLVAPPPSVWQGCDDDTCMTPGIYGDAQHYNLPAYFAIGQNLLNQLWADQSRRSNDVPSDTQ